MKKRLLSVLLIATLSLSIIACDGKSESTNTENAETNNENAENENNQTESENSNEENTTVTE